MICSVAHAQADKVIANPGAQRFHEIWRRRGAADEYVGNGGGGIGDINGDSINDFAVGIYRTWNVFLGAKGKPETAPVWTFDSLTPSVSHPIVGNFLGKKSKVVAFMGYEKVDPNNSSFIDSKLYLFSIDSGRIDSAPRVIIDPYRTASQVLLFPEDMFSTDIDHDGVDDIVIVASGFYRNKIPENRNQFWVYKGGENFNADSPAVIIKDDEVNDFGFANAAIGDFDHDGAMDFLIACYYHPPHQEIQKLKFFFGSPTNPWDWSAPPRTILLADSIHPRIGIGVTTLDCDGDGTPDIWLPANDGKSYLFRSRTGKNPRTRSYMFDDADNVFSVLPSGFNTPGALGYLSDSNRRYEMGGISGIATNGNIALLAFNGGPNGPDIHYDAMYDDIGDIFRSMAPIGDCNGDGWDDLLCFSAGYFLDNDGIAVILSGGPYIPRDSSLGVEDFPLEQKERALSLWPNPVRNELNIAWRGDLKRQPRHFVIADMLGRIVATGDVDFSVGAALWRCENVSAGAYVLMVYDRNGELLTTARLVKQ